MHRPQRRFGDIRELLEIGEGELRVAQQVSRTQLPELATPLPKVAEPRGDLRCNLRTLLVIDPIIERD